MNWRKETRAYAVELCQDLFAHWHAIYADSASLYDSECRRRGKGGATAELDEEASRSPPGIQRTTTVNPSSNFVLPA